MLDVEGMTLSPSLAVSVTSDAPLEPAQALAKRLQLPLISQDNISSFDFVLSYTSKGLALYQPKTSQTTPFIIDFLSDKLNHRLKQASLKNELLAKSIGLKPKDQAQIIDATAGLGRDGFLLASLGFQVTLIERSPILHALLEDALQRAATHPALKHLNLIQADAITYLPGYIKTLDQNIPLIIYLDPMFPERKKSAQVKKDMVLLQQLLGEPNDSEALFNLALTCASHRVVIKRPKLAPAINQRCPSFSLKGKSSRFDVYLV